jgi:chemotaxis protein methyltransferase CheR
VIGDKQRHVTDLQFMRFQALIERLAGIYLADSKRPLLAARLGQRVRELGLRDFGAYFDRVSEDAGECKRMLERICTNETHFFREPHHFDYLRDRLVPCWLDDARAGRRPRRIAVWSAGCSTGEEPYSVAMLLAHLLDGWDIAVVATDLSRRALDTAREATYSVDRASTIPPALRHAYVLRGVGAQDGKVKIAPAIRARVHFEQANLTEDPRAGQRFDLVLCRNVLIYFRPATRIAVLERLVSTLEPAGTLLLGHAESLPAVGLPLRAIQPTIYTRGEVA